MFEDLKKELGGREIFIHKEVYKVTENIDRKDT